MKGGKNMKEQNAWVAVAVVVIVAIVAGYFGMMTGGNALLAPSQTAVAPVCYGQRSGGGSTYGSGVSYYDGTEEGFKIAVEEAMLEAFINCGSDVDSEKERYEEFLSGAQRDCPLNDCSYVPNANENLDASTCKVVGCDAYSGGQECKYKVVNGVIVIPGTCEPSPFSSTPFVVCRAEDGRWNGIASCTPKTVSAPDVTGGE